MKLRIEKKGAWTEIAIAFDPAKGMKPVKVTLSDSDLAGAAKMLQLAAQMQTFACDLEWNR
ncbi:MAG: hypothetical protein K2R98_28355 [Gemmataceae bacterium]|nr:hypothetical protein [Gemmataceae bacterium]